MPRKMNWEMPIGDSRAIPFSALKKDGSPFDLTSQTVVMSISTVLPSGGTYQLTKSSANGGITVPAGTGGTATINMVPGDTAGLQPGVYQYDIVAVSATGVRTTLTTGQVMFTDHVARS